MLSLPYIVGDGGPSVLLHSKDARNWNSDQEFKKGIFDGGNTRTHYDAACEGGEWINQFKIDDITAISFSGEETPISWCIVGGALSIVRVICSSNYAACEDYAWISNVHHKSYVIRRDNFKIHNGEYYLMMAADRIKPNVWSITSFNLDYDVDNVDTAIFNDGDEVVIFHHLIRSPPQITFVTKYQL